jgi:hypothetical protein
MTTKPINEDRLVSKILFIGEHIKINISTPLASMQYLIINIEDHKMISLFSFFEVVSKYSHITEPSLASFGFWQLE